MPPKKKTKEQGQTTLNFKPLAKPGSAPSPAPLFTVEPAPLQPRKANVPGMDPSQSKQPRPSSSSASASYQRNESLQPFGGKGCSNGTTGTKSSDNVITTKNPSVSSSSVSHSESLSSSALPPASTRSAAGMFNKRIDFKESTSWRLPHQTNFPASTMHVTTSQPRGPA